MNVINNFLALDDVERIVKSNSDGSEQARLPLDYLPVLHDLSRTYNIHPVKVCLCYIHNLLLLLLFDDDAKFDWLIILDSAFYDW